MSGDSQWKGHRLGAYQLGERYTDVPEDEGQLYSARHIDTGEPALVVMPGPDEHWHTTSPWRTETTRFTQPDALVVHPRPAEGARRPSLHTLTLDFIRIAGALAGLDAREGAPNPFHDGSRKRPSRRNARRWGFAVAGLALAAVLALLLWPHASRLPDACDPTEETIIFANGREEAPRTIAYAMPDKPFKEQAKPPCLPEAEVEIRGGCWNELARTAPCARGTAEHQGKCYVPVKKPDPKPTSVQP